MEKRDCNKNAFPEMMGGFFTASRIQVGDVSSPVCVLCHSSGETCQKAVVDKDAFRKMFGNEPALYTSVVAR